MWPDSGGHISPPPVSSTNQIDPEEVLTTSRSLPRLLQIRTGRSSTQLLGPLCSSQPIESLSSTAARHPFLTSLLQHQPYSSMPERQTCQPPRTYQRTYRAIPRQRTCTHSASQASERSLQRRRIINNTPSLLFLSKRQGHITCMCSINNEPFHASTYDAQSDTALGDRPEETYRGSIENTHGHRRMWRLETMSVTHLENANRGRNREGRDEPQNRLSPSTSSNSLNFTPAIATTSLLFGNTSRISNLSHIIDSPSSLPSTSGTSHWEPDTNNCNKSICELTNHDRSTDEVSFSSPPSENDLLSSTVMCKLYTLSLPVMPPPSPNARQVAARVIKHARNTKIPEENLFRCPDCKQFPTLPVTGQCGHTRCTKCIQDRGPCPCGAQAPNTLLVNTLIQDLIRKILPKHSYSSVAAVEKGNSKTERTSLSASRYVLRAGGVRQRTAKISGFASLAARAPGQLPPHVPMSPQVRFQHARQLLAAGRFREAAPHLARVGAAVEPFSRSARSLLAQTITLLSKGRDPRRLTRELYRAVRLQGAASWLQPTDLECVLCYHTYISPVTTPCGHNYCRTCIERSMDYKKSCALCLRSLEDFNLAITRETVFICAALASIDALNSPLPPDPDVIPIFVCTVAYPTIPCPLFIFDPRYWLMIRRVLESGSRKFGMVTYERDRTYSNYGTVLEVCDCVHLEDGRSILSTVGVSRFKVIERDVRDGCDVARIQPLTDITPTEELVIWELRLMATQISYKALLWLNSMNRTVRSEIEAAFGHLPHLDPIEEDWFDSPDGPAWLWWLIAILPLRSEIKVLILSTKSLLKRMMAVSRTLEAIDHVAISSTVTSECELTNALTNAEEWLERGP
ncbi:uncharacterized protein LOC113238429 isoform X2 [Hyposmocoma kahamanoa]|uniref:uncharacterized protein LOC113238429 isoform X2 n=1 Tax=Hyposmocoma kahamanoa TaxID=1477025 RepID=UPI000E6D7483|nr:uncharacterized protein LOC113238429 isoform X2 [Hyposmocoma kahamanoa]